MTAKDLVERYGICRVGEMLKSSCGDLIKKDGVMDELKARKAEIMAYLLEEETKAKRAREEREAKLKAIEGLEELKHALYDEQRYRHEFNAMMDDESNDGAFPPKPVKVKYKDIAPKYPRAVAYLKAENYSFSENMGKRMAGKKALERILNGEDHELALADMEKEWSAYCEARMWD